MTELKNKSPKKAKTSTKFEGPRTGDLTQDGTAVCLECLTEEDRRKGVRLIQEDYLPHVEIFIGYLLQGDELANLFSRAEDKSIVLDKHAGMLMILAEQLQELAEVLRKYKGRYDITADIMTIYVKGSPDLMKELINSDIARPCSILCARCGEEIERAPCGEAEAAA